MNSNAFTAADMTTAAANGHRDGYQAGYADAVKAVEVGKPAAAQEAVAPERVAWASTGATGHKVVAMAGLHKLPYGDYDLFAAPVAAAPVDPSKLGAAMRAFDDAGGHAVSYAPAWMRKALEAASTPAEPGIDLEQFRDAVVDAWRACDPGTKAESKVDALLALIDASPKGGSDAESRFAFCAKHEAFPIRTEDGRNWIMFVATDPAYPNIRAAHVAATPEAAIDAAMQTTSAEVGVMCATCQDSGEVIGQEGSGPDVYDVTVICPNCSQQPTSHGAGVNHG